MRTVYLAGPIAGCDIAEANDWRKDIGDELLPYNIKGISPLRCEPLIKARYEVIYDDPRFGCASAINGKNWFDTMNCDMILAYLPKELNSRRPSYGTVIEIGWAIGARKPIIVWSDDPYLRNHPLITCNVNWILDTQEDVLDVIIGLLGDYA